MKVAIITNGSRGDVQPYLALARGLLDRGHTVTIATLAHFRDLAERYGIDFRPLHQEPFFRIVKELRKGVLRSPRAIVDGIRGEFEAAFDEWLAATEGADLIVAHPLVAAAPDIAEARRIPLVVASVTPALCPTGEFPHALVSGVSRGAAVNRATFHAAAAVTIPVDAVRRRWRRARLGLSTPLVPMTGDARWPLHHLHGHSPLVLSRPRDWPDRYSVDGFWRLPERPHDELPPDLERFIASGEAPVYVGFGSMVVCPPEHTRTILDALMAKGCRAIVARCSGALRMDIAREYDPGRVHPLDGGDVSFDALFARVAAVVHHAGIGTMAIAMRAGKPQICCPFRFDQPFWAERARRIGIAPEPLPIARMSVEGLRRRLDAVLGDTACARAAQRLQTHILQEDGVAVSVARLERLVATGAASLPQPG